MSTPTPATKEITTFLSSQLSSFRSFLSTSSHQNCDLSPYQLEKEIALHNTRMLKVVSDFNKQNQNQNLTPPFLPIPSGRGEWDDSGGVFTGGVEMRGNNSFQSHARGYNQEGGRNLFTSHNARRKSKGYVKAGASTLFKSGGSGGRFERRIFGYEFDDDSSMGSVDEDEEETPSKRWRSGNGKREKQSDGKGKGKMNGEVVVLDSSDSEGEVKDNRIVEVDADIKKEARRASSGILKSEMGRGGEDEDKAAVINEGKSAHQQRMNWILERRAGRGRVKVRKRMWLIS
jgi:hypothetical protein